ncbi:uncharacterized protein L203_105880 [Cryptococcus depauperatus CBS 7841]|uniref:Uncharacterized protein n=1 Tax=Cryptococcus depauperatus CBS 7841 TaxID=1295531 RepID=A0A1E3I9U9_9TREE|nr:hypothetical protein L203_05035 [Cryptococcus depauperatus CBS 7841]
MLANHGLAWRREGLDGLLRVLQGGRVVDTSRGVDVDAVNGMLDSVGWVVALDRWVVGVLLRVIVKVACPFYNSWVVKGVNRGESKWWLQRCKVSILSTRLSWSKGGVLDGIFKPASAGDVESKREAHPVQ